MISYNELDQWMRERVEENQHLTFRQFAILLSTWAKEKGMTSKRGAARHLYDLYQKGRWDLA